MPKMTLFAKERISIFLLKLCSLLQEMEIMGSDHPSNFNLLIEAMFSATRLGPEIMGLPPNFNLLIEAMFSATYHQIKVWDGADEFQSSY